MAKSKRRFALDAASDATDVRALQTGNAALIEFIRHRIQVSGPVTFAWFMEQALYHPEHGYYSSERAAIGRKGDYFTNVSVGPLYGELMATQFVEMWQALGAPAEFTIVEQGAHDGQFAHDVLSAIEHSYPAFFDAVRYEIVEPFAPLRHRQSELLSQFDARVSWRTSIDAVVPFCGIHFSNELWDALPVHLLRWTGTEWRERYVTINGDDFTFEDSALSSEALSASVGDIAPPTSIDYTTEVSLVGLSLVGSIAQKLTRGFVLAVDYGFSRDDFYAPHRTTGTLQCYRDHQLISSPLTHVGDADLTAHVEWSSIVPRAEHAGLQLLGFTDQHHFITGLLANADGGRLIDEENPKRQRALQTLLHPGFLGMKFQFLVLGKDVEPKATLAGLRFARDPRETLGLKRQPGLED